MSKFLISNLLAVIEIKIFRVSLMVVASMFCTACSSITPHENFLSLMQLNVGKKVGQDQGHGMAPQTYLGSRDLPDGNIELEYKYIKSCRLYFAVDKVNNVVKSWRYEGANADCIVPN
jgi:sarcosine oxidase delta subunit